MSTIADADRKVRDILGGPGLTWVALVVAAAVALPITLATVGPFGTGALAYTLGITPAAAIIARIRGQRHLLRFLVFASLATVVVVVVGATGAFGLADSWSGGSACVAFLGAAGVLALYRLTDDR